MTSTIAPSKSSSSGSSVQVEAGRPWPKLVAFDLDHTLWPLGIEDDIQAPLRRATDDDTTLLDARGHKLAFFPDVIEVLRDLKHRGVYIAAASATKQDKVAKEALDLLQLPSPVSKDGADGDLVTAASLFNQFELYDSPKFNHFDRIRDESGIDYEDMLFFDDKSENKAVQDLGVVTKRLEAKVGLDRASFEAGLNKWAERKDKRE